MRGPATPTYTATFLFPSHFWYPLCSAVCTCLEFPSPCSCPRGRLTLCVTNRGHSLRASSRTGTHRCVLYTICGVPFSRPGACPVVYHGEGEQLTHIGRAARLPGRRCHKDEGAGVGWEAPHSAAAFLAVTTATQRHVTHFPVYHWTRTTHGATRVCLEARAVSARATVWDRTSANICTTFRQSRLSRASITHE
jgi:hypothetical protein